MNLNGTLNERIADIEFITELFYKKEFMISNFKFPLDFSEKGDFNIQAIQNIHEGLLKLKRLLEKLNVKVDINLDNISDKDRNNINILLDGILEEKNIPFNLDTKCKILLLPVLNIKLALFIQKQQDGSCKISNIFSDWCEKDGIKAEFTLDNGKGYELLLNNIFIMLNSEYYMCDNFDSNIVFKKLTEIKGNENYYNSVVQVLLNLVTAYDSCSNIVLLDLADRLIDWLIEELGDININILNKIQIKSRRGTIDTEDYKRLLQIKENDNDKTIKLGASILLKSKHEVDYYYSQLPNNIQNAFKKYPIYNLLW